MANFTGLLDMFDGGGAGASGQSFKGGLLSGLLNQIGVKPLVYRDRMEAMQNTRPQLRPQVQPQVSTQSQPQPMQYSGRGSAGMPSQPMQGSGMTPANAYAPQMGMTTGSPITQATLPPQAPASGEGLRSMMMQAYPGMDEDQLRAMTMEFLRKNGGM